MGRVTSIHMLLSLIGDIALIYADRCALPLAVLVQSVAQMVQVGVQDIAGLARGGDEMRAERAGGIAAQDDAHIAQIRRAQPQLHLSRLTVVQQLCLRRHLLRRSADGRMRWRRRRPHAGIPAATDRAGISPPASNDGDVWRDVTDSFAGRCVGDDSVGGVRRADRCRDAAI